MGGGGIVLTSTHLSSSCFPPETDQVLMHGPQSFNKMVAQNTLRALEGKQALFKLLNDLKKNLRYI